MRLAREIALKARKKVDSETKYKSSYTKIIQEALELYADFLGKFTEEIKMFQVEESYLWNVTYHVSLNCG